MPKEYEPEDFWKKVDVKSETECWNWKGHSQRYGRLIYQREEIKAHRLAYRLTYGKFDDSLCILHPCDNPLCCNPKHLFIGTQDDNMKDMVAKGRSNHPIGERNPMYGRTNSWKAYRG